MYKFEYNGVSYAHSPYLSVVLGFDGSMPILGEPLKDVLGMTEQEAEAAHAEGLLNELREARNKLLAETDWTAGTDVPQEIKNKWLAYRQSLRDITQTYSSLEDAVFPPKPE